MGKQFNDIKSRNQLADFLGFPRNMLTNILYIEKVDSYYSTFEIPKKSGGTRTISAPDRELKAVQTRLAHCLQQHQDICRKARNTSPNISHGFEKHKSIVTNAAIHRNKRYVINLDLENFFSSFHFGRVLGFFQKNKDFLLPYEVAVVIAQLACFNGCLPQGAPSSPIIANLICQSLDMRLLSVAKGYKLDYTRYADDLTFSTNDPHFPENQDRFLKAITRKIEHSGFTINDQKTHIQFKDSRQEVTGLIVNSKLSVDHRYVKETRAMAHQMYTTGEFTIDGQTGTLHQLEGRFSFIDYLDRYNNKCSPKQSAKGHVAYNLNGREKQYQEFLFYKYFVHNEVPVLFTEGKTDRRYIKAALKNLHSRYPDLIEKSSDDCFRFKISFFNRSKRFCNFFHISADGADAMKTLYHYFSGTKNCKNYAHYFYHPDLEYPKYPVIFLFDNETEEKKPLRFFLKEAHISQDDVRILQKQFFLRLTAEKNLFLLTYPLPAGKPEVEIEDLLPADFLTEKHNGKKFCRDDKVDRTLFMDKEEFSSYVLEHYKDIDFSGFIPFLDTLNTLTKSLQP